MSLIVQTLTPMHRNRRLTAVRRALTASLLSVAVLAQAQTSAGQKVEESAWTQVNLDDAVTPAVPVQVKSAQVKSAQVSSGAAKAAVASAVPSVTAKAALPTQALPAPLPAKGALVPVSVTSLSKIAPPTKPPADAKAVEPVQHVTAKLVEAKSTEAKPVEAKAPPTFALSAKDRTIQAGLLRWATSSGWKLSWELPEGTQAGIVRFDADFGADFDVALSKLAAAMRSETKVHAYLYANNKVLRIVEEPTKQVVSSAVPMTPTIPDGIQKDSGDRGLPYVTRVKGYWLGATGTETESTPATALPRVFSASVSLVFSDKANMATVVGILSKVTGVPIALPGAIEIPATKLFVNDGLIDGKVDAKKKTAAPKSKLTYIGTPKALLDRISVSTGLLWDFQDDTIVFTE